MLDKGGHPADTLICPQVWGFSGAQIFFLSKRALQPRFPVFSEGRDRVLEGPRNLFRAIMNGFFPLRVLGYLLAGFLEIFRRPFPPIVRIETTNLCNAHCTFCPRESIGRSKGFMEQDLFEKIVSECANSGCSVLHLHNFGEPLLDERLPERVGFAKAMGMKQVKIFTNGALLKGTMAERLIRSGLDEVKVSFDGATAEEFRRIRCGLDLDDVLKNTITFKALRNNLGRNRPFIVATCTFTSNKEKTRDLLKAHVDKIVFADRHNWSGERHLPTSSKLRQPCIRLWQTFTILVSGDVALCCLDHSGKEILGNCRQQTIAGIWEGYCYEQLRGLHRRSEQYKIPLCDRCSMSFLQPKQIESRLGFLPRKTRHGHASTKS